MLDWLTMKHPSVRLNLLVLLSSVLQLVPFPIAGPAPLWRRFFCWFCLVPLLYVLTAHRVNGRHLSIAQSSLLGYACGVLWFMGNCYWIFQTMHIYGRIPELASAGILLLFALYLGLYFALFSCIVSLLRRRFTFAQLMVFVPFLWVAVELARARITGFPWDLLGYTQVDNSVLTMLAPWGGVMLLSFIVVAVNALFCVACAMRGTARLKWLAGVLLLAAALQCGALRTPSAPPADQQAVLLQENLAVGADGDDLAPFPMQQKYDQFIDWSLHPLAASAASPALIVWPEAPAQFFTTDPQFRGELGSLARAAGAPVIVGSVGVDVDPASRRGYHEFGSAAVFSSNGNYIGRYDKMHRVPWGEYVPYAQLFSFAGKLVSGVGDMEPGTQHTVFNLSGHPTGIFICYESIFGDEVREFVRNGAEVLVNISDDGWYGDSGAPWQHLDMARMRAIENDRWILRDTNTGITTAIDPHGRGDFLLPRHVRAAFAVRYGYRTGTTFYTRHGDWFAWLCACITAGALGIALATRPIATGSRLA